MLNRIVFLKTFILTHPRKKYICLYGSCIFYECIILVDQDNESLGNVLMSLNFLIESFFQPYIFRTF